MGRLIIGPPIEALHFVNLFYYNYIEMDIEIEYYITDMHKDIYIYMYISRLTGPNCPLCCLMAELSG